MIRSHTRKVYPYGFTEETVVTDKGIVINLYAPCLGEPKVTITRGSRTKTFQQPLLVEARRYFAAAVRVLA